ncbi:hypothetical protein ACFFNY_08345 [Paenibacillus hodogayensis]|uniref:Uncharacterized protein n=1 Tax=Paenibacillus hodogayensis TaxID=279208 RepID=A0ABV5VTI8_9BACL
MNASLSNTLPQTWVDDYLDLYNYAGRLGDTEWQREILAVLGRKDELIRHDVRELLREELWGKFDRINRKMLHIFEELRNTKNERQTEALREQAWELKVQRCDISRKIKAIAI